MSDSAQDNRRLRAAQESMRTKQKMATGAATFGAILVAASFKFADIAPTVRVVLGGFGSLLALGAYVPFLLSECPKCKGRYHGIGSVFRNADNPPPCRSCGFQVNRHISRYA
jgi:hypothetical protein